MPPKAAAKPAAKGDDKSPKAKGKDEGKKEQSVGKKGTDPKMDDAEKLKLLTDSGLLEAYECRIKTHHRRHPKPLQSRPPRRQHL